MLHWYPSVMNFLFGEYTYCLNLGGFANVSFKQKRNRIAFDIGPCNLVLNTLVQREGLKFDDRGELARIGTLNRELLERLNGLPYFAKPAPKSLGREWLEDSVFPIFKQYPESPTADLLNTSVEWMAQHIGDVLQGDNVLVTGGGAYNDYLIERIRFYSGAEIVLPDPKTIEYKEALIFGYLGWLRYHEKINVLSSVTGARKDHSSGSVYVPSEKK